MAAEKLRLTVLDVVQETGDAHSIVFEKPPEVSYKPGQFLTLRLPCEDHYIARCYSLSSAPDIDAHLKVTVKRVRGGRGSNWICDNVRRGDQLEVLPPSGTFTPMSLDKDYVLLAGGSGITPVMSILRTSLTKGSNRMLLVYANRDEASVIFHRELRELVAEHPRRLVVLHWLETVQGLPALEPLHEIVRPWSHGEAFICGPAPFMDCAADALKAMGMPRDRIHIERFNSLASDPWVEVEAIPSAGGPRTDLVVTLDGETHELDWPQDQKLLDFLLERGLDAPYSCREGACSACGVKLLGGEVKMENNSVLEQDDIDEGWRLACQARPTTNAVKISYDD
jgi:3-ketosteroid 9alpha-monooxygenase subunit B